MGRSRSKATSTFAIISAATARIAGAAVLVGFLTGFALPSAKSAAQPHKSPAARLMQAAGGHGSSSIRPGELEARTYLEERVQQLSRQFPGNVGVAVRDLQSGWTTDWQGDAYFPQQSVSKFWVALTALDQVDRGMLDLSKTEIVRRSDLTLFHQPIAALVKKDGYSTTLGALMVRALTESDNTANDFILRRAGGPEAVRNFLRRKGIDGVRFGPGERLLQSQTAGLTWRQEYSLGDGFSKARSALPISVRRAAFERYMANPIDGATPLGIVDGLEKLRRGELLSPATTRQLLDTMANTKTGKQRLRGGLSPGWTLSHKTGTGQNFDGTTAGYNDIGIITSPNGRAYALSILIGRTKVAIPARQFLMNEIVRAVISYDHRIGG
jgi:beta-lactamase class A